MSSADRSLSRSWHSTQFVLIMPDSASVALVPHGQRLLSATHVWSDSGRVGWERGNLVECGITAVYDRHSYDPEKRHALDLWGNYVERVAAGEPAPSNVIELARTGQ